MEPYRSTLATTAIAVLGLFVAAHVLHPGNYEKASRTARVVAVTVEAASVPRVWTDPPHKLLGTEPAALMADSDTLLAHHLTMAPPPGARTLPRVSSTLAPPADKGRDADGDPIGDLIRGLDRDRNG
jgi:hypothetical protein